MDMTKYAGSESKYLKAADLQGKRPRVVIDGVELLEFEEENGKVKHKPALVLRGKEKKLVLNATNTEEIMRAYGSDSDDWKGREIQLSTKHYPKFGVDGLVVTALGSADDPNDEIPFN